MKKIENTTVINAPADIVWQVLMDEKYYLKWYEAFGEGSNAISDWQVGSKIIFTDGSGMGLIGTIAVLNPAKEFKVAMRGILAEGVEDYESPDAKNIQIAEERYVLKETDGVTTLYTTADMDESWYEAMSASWTKALQTIKTLSENY
jgi:hypothetical protein